MSSARLPSILPVPDLSSLHAPRQTCPSLTCPLCTLHGKPDRLLPPTPRPSLHLRGIPTWWLLPSSSTPEGVFVCLCPGTFPGCSAGPIQYRRGPWFSLRSLAWKTCHDLDQKPPPNDDHARTRLVASGMIQQFRHLHLKQDQSRLRFLPRPTVLFLVPEFCCRGHSASSAGRWQCSQPGNNYSPDQSSFHAPFQESS